jgi:hypothetical protein
LPLFCTRCTPVGGERRAGLGAVEQVRVVGELAQLHGDVHQAQLRLAAAGVDHLEVLEQQLAVPLALHGAERHVELHLALRRQLLRHVALEAAQQKRPQHFVQLANHLLLLVLVGQIEPLVKVVRRGEHVGQQEVEQRPQLVQIVLQRRAGEQQAIGGVKVAHHRGELGVLVLDAVRLVDDQVLEAELGQRRLLDHGDLVRRQHDVERVRHELLGDEGGARLLVAVELAHAARRKPLVELAIPVAERRLGHNDDVRAGDAARLGEVGEQRDRLQRFAEAHLVGENAADAVVVEPNEPVETLDLVRPHGAVLNRVRLLRQPHRAAAVAVVERLVQNRLVLGRLGLAPAPPFALGDGGVGRAHGAVGGGVGAVHAAEKMRKHVALLNEILQARLLRRAVGARHRRLLLRAHQIERFLLLAFQLFLARFFGRHFFFRRQHLQRCRRRRRRAGDVIGRHAAAVDVVVALVQVNRCGRFGRR